MKDLIDIVEEQIRIYQKEVDRFKRLSEYSEVNRLTGKVEAGKEILAMIKILAKSA